MYARWDGSTVIGRADPHGERFGSVGWMIEIGLRGRSIVAYLRRIVRMRTVMVCPLVIGRVPDPGVSILRSRTFIVILWGRFRLARWFEALLAWHDNSSQLVGCNFPSAVGRATFMHTPPFYTVPGSCPSEQLV